MSCLFYHPAISINDDRELNIQVYLEEAIDNVEVCHTQEDWEGHDQPKISHL